MLVSERCRKIESSITLGIAARAQALRDQGEDIISMNAGEPDFDTPLHIKAAAMDAIQEGKTKYTPVGGTPQLKAAIQEKLLRENNLNYEKSEIMACTGGKQAIFNAFMSILNKGDEVILPAPYWSSYPDMIKLAEGEPVLVQTKLENQFKLHPYQIQEAITPYTRLIIINSPCNPTGACYSEEELQALSNVLVNHPKIMIMTDDVYEKIHWHEEQFQNIVNVVPSLQDRTIIINSLSKTYAMTGWRLGYAAGPEKIIQAMHKIQSQSTANPCSIAQCAAIEALSKYSADSINEMVHKYKARHRVLCERLERIDGIRFVPAHGGFYVLADVGELITNLQLADDVAFTEFLLDKAKVSVVPGSAFGAKNHIRLSFATNKTKINLAFDHIEQALAAAIMEQDEDEQDSSA